MAPVTVGGVESYSSATVALALFPALSRQLPATEAEPESGPEYVVAPLQLSMPDTASVPVKATPTGWLYQPFESPARAGDAETLGGVASYWNENVFGAETRPAPLVHVAETEAELESGPE